MENKEKNREAFVNFINSITNFDQHVLSELCKCFDSPKEYYENNYSFYEYDRIIS